MDAKDVENVWLLCSPMKSSPHPIAENREIYRDRFGSTEKYRPYLLEDRPANRNAWEIMYDKFAKGEITNKSAELAKINKGYSRNKEDNENTSLNKFCAEAYSKKDSELTGDNYRKNVLKFCTFTPMNLSTSK